MPRSTVLDVDLATPPFDRCTNVRRLSTDRSGHDSPDHERYRLLVAHERQQRADVLIKVTARAGAVYEQDLANEVATLSTINRERPDSPYFPVMVDHGRLPDGRAYLTTSLFDEFPLAASVGAERRAGNLVAALRATIASARALVVLHELDIVHVDLNPMNILYAVVQGRPVVRIVDFESSWERSRHAAGAFYSPPTTPGFSAPEVARQAPDARADVFSLGAVLYTLLSGYGWTWEAEAGAAVAADADLDADLKTALLRAVAADPADRFPSSQDLLDALGAYLERIWPGRDW
jgi:serine/threonine protein kinase